MALGPAADGGYYLVALDRDAFSQVEIDNLLSELFSGKSIDWGGPTVCAQQSTVAKRMGLKCKFLGTVLSDVDTAEDLPTAQEALGLSIDQLRKVKDVWGNKPI